MRKPIGAWASSRRLELEEEPRPGRRRHEAVKDALVTAGAEHRELPETLHRRGRPLRSHEGNSGSLCLALPTYVRTYTRQQTHGAVRWI